MASPSPDPAGGLGSGTTREAPEKAPPARPPPENATGGAAPEPPGGAAAAPAAPLQKSVIQGLIIGLDRADADLADPLATNLARDGITQAQFDARYSDVGAVRGAILQTWFGGAAGAVLKGKVKAVASKDPIAIQKLADLDAEQYLEVPTKKDDFYTQLATRLESPSLDRTRIFPIMTSLAKLGFLFKGQKVPDDRVSPFQSRNQGVDKLYDINQVDVDIDLQMEQDWTDTGAPLAALPPGAKTNTDLRKKAYRHILKRGRPPMGTIDTSKDISNYPTWYAPGEISVPPGSAETAYGQMMQLGALQPEWYPNGTVVLNIHRKKVAAAQRELRKPTAFDGMMSALWTARNQPGEVYGVTGGGLGEFLEAGVTYADVSEATAVIPNDNYLDEIQRLSATVPRGSSTGEELLRGNAVGTNLTTGLYQGLIDRTTQEANNPGDSPIAPGATNEGVGGPATPGHAPAVSGGTFDAGRQKPVR